MRNRFVLYVGIIAVMLLSGCATVSKMPLNAGMAGVDTAQKSILIAKVTIQNKKSLAHQPKLCCVFLEKEGETLSFTEPTLVSEISREGKEYLVSADVLPGKAKVNMARFIRQVPMLLMAMADLPFDQEIDVPPNSVVYIGNITAVIRDKSGDEPAAGSLFPLIDQAVAGFSTGTFDVEIIDNYDADIQEFRSQYPQMKNREVIKKILPSWVHPEKKDAAI